jgi:acyl carrier protein
MDVAAQVNDVLARNFGVHPGPDCGDTPLRRLKLDSLALEELRLLLEDRFDIELEDVELTTRDTYGDLLAAVRGRATA